MFTFHPELQLDLWQKQKYCNVYFFFPRNDNYSYPNIFQTSTTKMEKAFQKIIYEIGTYILGSPYMEMAFFFFLPCHEGPWLLAPNPLPGHGVVQPAELRGGRLKSPPYSLQSARILAPFFHFKNTSDL